MAAARAAASGKPFGEVLQAAESARDSVRCLYVLDTMRYVHRTGRVPRKVGGAAERLSIRPVCKIGKDGLAHLVTLGRSLNKGVELITRMLREGEGNGSVDVMVMHAAAEPQAQELKYRVQAEFNCRSIVVSEFSPIMGYATGPGVLGLAVCPAQ